MSNTVSGHSNGEDWRHTYNVGEEDPGAYLVITGYDDAYGPLVVDYSGYYTDSFVMGRITVVGTVTYKLGGVSGSGPAEGSGAEISEGDETSAALVANGGQMEEAPDTSVASEHQSGAGGQVGEAEEEEQNSKPTQVLSTIVSGKDNFLPYLEGLVTGFFVDGALGTAGDAGDAAKWSFKNAWRFTPIGWAITIPQMGMSAGEAAAGVSPEVIQALKKAGPLGAALAKDLELLAEKLGPGGVYRFMTGNATASDVAALSGWASQLSPETLFLLGQSEGMAGELSNSFDEIVGEIGSTFSEMDDAEVAELVGRLVGALLFELALDGAIAGATAGAASPVIVAKVLARLRKLEKVPGLDKLLANEQLMDKVEDAYTKLIDRVRNFSSKADAVLTGCFVAGTSVLVQVPVAESVCLVCANSDSPELTNFETQAMSIEDVELGSRVSSQNPDSRDVRPTVIGDDETPTLRRVEIEFYHSNGAVVDVELLRPTSWLDEHQMVAGGQINVWLTEIDVKGHGLVKSVSAAPEIIAGTDSLVTGRFRTRRADDIVSVTFADGTELQGTMKHPVWSVRDGAWVGLGELNSGDLVQARDGNLEVAHVDSHFLSAPVYNIEIDQQHVYEVTPRGILVHNNGVWDCDEYTDLLTRKRRGETLTDAENARFSELDSLKPDDFVAPKGIGPDDMIPDGISFDIANPKYRRFKSGDDILEYTLEGGEITVDWVSGKNASSMMEAILKADGAGVTKISGYVTDNLGGASNAALQRLGDQMAGKMGGGWKATIEMIEGRRYLVFTK